MQKDNAQDIIERKVEARVSTHCHIGIMNPENKTIVGTYVHCDGYPDNMVSAIQDYVRAKTLTGLHVLITESQAHAGLRGLYRPAQGDIEFLEGGELEVVNEINFLDPVVNYAYLIHDDTGLLETFRRDLDKGGRWEKVKEYETHVPV